MIALSIRQRFAGRLSMLATLFEALDTSSLEGRARERQRRILLSALTAMFAKVISVSTGLISVPLTLGYLGVERYGMWMTMSSLVGMLSFADFGISNGLLSEIAKAYGADDKQDVQRLVSSAYFILILVAIIIIALFLFFYPLVNWYRIFNVSTTVARQEAGQAVAVLVICFALAIPIGVVQRVQMGLQRGFMASLWQCAGSLLALAGVLIAIHLHAPLPILVLAFVGAPLAAGLMNSFVFFGILQPGLMPLPGLISRVRLAAITHTGMLFFVMQIVSAVMYSSDNIILAQMLGPKSVAAFSIPTQLFNLITAVFAIFLSPLWPAYAEAIARHDHAWVRVTLHRSLITSVSLAALAAACLVFASPLILSVWVKSAITPTFMFLVGLGVWKTVEVSGNALAMYLNGAHIVRLQVITCSMTAAISVPLKIAMVAIIGLPGIVFGSSISYVALTTIPTYICLIFFGRGRSNGFAPDRAVNAER